MGTSVGGIAARGVGVVYGVLFTAIGLGVLVFLGIPVDLVYALPPAIGREILKLAPWLMYAGGGPLSESDLAFTLVATVFVLFGLWSLASALFGSGDSIRVRLGGP